LLFIFKYSSKTSIPFTITISNKLIPKRDITILAMYELSGITFGISILKAENATVGLALIIAFATI